jgi:cytochrome c peroxidase
MVVGVLTFACSQTPQEGDAAETPAMPVGEPVTIAAPLGLPPVPVPADNPPTANTIALGRSLYYDPILSADGTVSCASCHSPDKGFSDGLPVSIGIAGKKGGRNAPTVLNSAYYTLQFWDGRAPSLEDQAGNPMQNPVEMGHSDAGVVQALEGNPTYQQMFEIAYGPGPITFAKVRHALASFERTMISGNSPFDRYRFGGDKSAMSDSAIRGLEIFMSEEKGDCAECHTIEDGFALFTDNEFHNLGAGLNNRGEMTDLGRHEVTMNDADRGAFKTPTLRNIAQSAPYMHDGSLATLKDVVDFYVGGGNSNDYLDEDIKELKLSAEERADLEAFLNALTGEMPDGVGSPSAPAAGGSR